MPSTRPWPGPAFKSVGPVARPRVLIVDDDEKILRGFARALKRNYDVLLATSPGVALAMTEAHALDVVLTDFDLGDENGHDGVWLLEPVRKHHPDSRRILMSGRDRDIEEHVESGLVGHFIAKPVAAADVRKLLETKL